MDDALLHYFRVWLSIMAVEALIYIVYLGRCAWRGTFTHRMFWAATGCLCVLLIEMLRAGIILRYHIYVAKDVLVFSLEIFPFGVIAYEILKKYTLYVYTAVAMLR